MNCLDVNDFYNKENYLAKIAFSLKLKLKISHICSLAKL